MRKVLILLFAVLPLLSTAQLIACRDSIKDGYDFWLYLPDDYSDTADCKKPVIMFLHGKSLSGNDLSKVRRYGCLDAIERGRSIDAVVIAPQTNNGWSPQKVMDVYQWTRSHYVIDTNRFYVIGMSMGGYGTLDFVSTYPEKVAAAMALCGGCNNKDVCRLNSVPLWIVHGTADKAVPISQSDQVVDAMRGCGDTVLLRYDRLPGADHGRPARAFYLKQTYDWLFSHSLQDSVRHLNTDYEMSMSVLANAYSDLSGKKRNLKVVDSSSHEEKAVTGASEYYCVKKGDTLSKIARKHNVSVARLCSLNRINETSVLKIGQRVKVK